MLADLQEQVFFKERNDMLNGTYVWSFCENNITKPIGSSRLIILNYNSGNMKKIFAFITINSVLILLIAGCQSSGKASASRMLKFNLENGKAYDYETNWLMDQEIMGQASKMEIFCTYGIEVVNETADIKTLKSTYKRFKMHMKILGLDLKSDTDDPKPLISANESENDPAGLMSRVFTGIAGKSFFMKVNQEGEILEVTGFKEIIAGILDSLTVPGEIKVQLRASLQDQFNEQSTKDFFSNAFFIFPAKEVKLGDSWKKTTMLGGKIGGKQTTTYTVTAVEGDIYTLGTESGFSSEGEQKVTGTQTSTLLVDSRTGLLVNGDYEQKLKVDVEGMPFNINAKGYIKGSERK